MLSPISRLKVAMLTLVGAAGLNAGMTRAAQASDWKHCTEVNRAEECVTCKNEDCGDATYCCKL